MSYLEGFYETQDPFVQTTKKAIREELHIPERSLDRVLKALKAEQKILKKDVVVVFVLLRLKQLSYHLSR